jgi:hypothetical protein
MGRTSYYVGASLDGFIADPDGGIGWLTEFEGVEDLEAHYERLSTASAPWRWAG